MNTQSKRTLMIIVTAVMAFAFLVGGNRLTAFAREMEHQTEFSSSDDAAKQSGEFEFTGKVEALSAESWTVGGQTLAILPATEIKGQFQVGDLVKVHAFPYGDGYAAREIEAAAGQPDSTDDNSNEAIEGNGNESLDNNSNQSWEDNSNQSPDDGQANDNGDDQGGHDNGNDNDDDHSGRGKNGG